MDKEIRIKQEKLKDKINSYASVMIEREEYLIIPASLWDELADIIGYK